MYKSESLIASQKARADRYAKCLKLVPELKFAYISLGYPAEDLDANILMAENLGLGKVDTSRWVYFSNKNVEFAKLKFSAPTFEAKCAGLREYYRYYALCCLWCAMQQIAVGAYIPAVEVAGKAMGYFAGYKYIKEDPYQDNPEDNIRIVNTYAAAQASEIESDYLNKNLIKEAENDTDNE